ncbi:pantoate--beta-alanine ligase [Sphingomonas sp. MAH-20]|uniref:Pantothenate synthetase n=1 Tax=Sphingomonas horti TaxID=2682842 RepID=A0A6I4J3S1_9SPHN|nr:pantoate--beta-alanine ligase [Sphingomonas sp. CGMCC 1.13658]MBA2918953.1 pantoate--beta-alanine ligase [Sphingomonas sp. CGMCC 1.13658]MVO78986.1 pantoate--beta-alanine ligase [Sphingomonas horti]
MQTIRQLKPLRKALAALCAEGGKLALVPTMGALHAGHMALVAEARKRAKHVVVSIFVNPRQFGANEDLGAYPRRAAKDSAMLSEAGAALLWMPDAEVMYPAGYATSISVAGVSEGLDGAARPGHFEGVATVVAKLFNQVRPDVALFGEKDFQQLAVVRRMVADLDFGIEIVGVPTERDEDGLALSSRNVYLTEEERQQARALPRALGMAASAIEGGGDVGEALARAEAALVEGGFQSVDYVTLCDAATLQPLESLDRPARLLAAARIGAARLIDNVPVMPRDLSTDPVNHSSKP